MTTGADGVVAEAIGRVEGKLDSFDVRLRTLEIDVAMVRSSVNRPAPVWPAIVGAVVPNLISAIALLVILMRPQG
jgi:hypothetical protein